jgi:hypothetical protein
MNASELKGLRERSHAKHMEIRKAMIKLEDEFISEHSKYKVGDKYLISSSVVRNKKLDVYGEVVEMRVCHDLHPLPTIRTTINKDGKYHTTIRQHV